MLQILQAEGFEITARTLRRLRSKLGLRRRTKPVEAQLQVEKVIREIQSELDIPNSTLSHHLDKLKNEGLVLV